MRCEARGGNGEQGVGSGERRLGKQRAVRIRYSLPFVYSRPYSLIARGVRCEAGDGRIELKGCRWEGGRWNDAKVKGGKEDERGQKPAPDP